MIKIKMCGLRRETDIEYANKLMPDYIGYVLKALITIIFSDWSAEIYSLFSFP